VLRIEPTMQAAVLPSSHVVLMGGPMRGVQIFVLGVMLGIELLMLRLMLSIQALMLRPMLLIFVMGKS